MSIRIAQASSSETYSKYGIAPNQRRTGVTASKPEGNLDGELNVIKFSGGWKCVYRPLDDSVAEKIANFMYKAVANGSHIGYSQDSTRFGVFDALRNLGSTDPSKISTLVNCDCATLVGAAIYYSGLHLTGLRELVTWEMDSVLLNSGKFAKIETKEMCEDGKGIRKGDILWRTGHTAVAIDSDETETRLSLTDSGLKFKNASGVATGVYPSSGKQLLKENSLRTNDLSGNSYYLYSVKGTNQYTLASDATYLVTYTQRNSTTSSNDSVWIVSAHKNNSHIVALKQGSTKATISGLVLTITRASTYGRISITRLC